MGILNVDVESIIAQKVEKDEAAKDSQKKKQFGKVEFNEDHYLDTRLTGKETEKEIVIRLLPFSETELSPFYKIAVHSVRMTNEKGQKVWKKFVCPIGVGKSDKCPFCETSEQARKKKFELYDADKKIDPTLPEVEKKKILDRNEIERKKLGDIEFMYKRKDYWLVRCIDRAHEDHGVKFWRFPDAKNGEGVFDKMYALMTTKRKRGVNIFDLYEGKDIIITVTKKVEGAGKEKMVYQIQDDEVQKPLSDSDEQMEKWVYDSMTWEDVYSIKDYDYMSLVAQGEYPVWSKNLNRWIGKSDAESIEQEAKQQEIEESLTESTTDFASFTVQTGATKTEQAIVNGERPSAKSSSMFDGEDLPF